jgi:hypothetical protein
LLDPDLCFDVEVVGRFVEEEDVGLLEEEFCHGDTHLPAAGEFRAIAREVFILETEALEDGLDFGFHEGWVVGIEFEFEFADFLEEVAVGGGTWIEFDEFFGEAIDFFLESHDFAEGGFGFLPERAAFDVNAFLREVADLGTLGFVDLSGGGWDDAGDAFHQGGFSSAIMPCEGDAFAGQNGEGKIVKKDAGAVFDAKGLDGNHGRGGGCIRMRAGQWKGGSLRACCL